MDTLIVKGVDGQNMMINAIDYNPEIHTLIEGQVAPEITSIAVDEKTSPFIENVETLIVIGEDGQPLMINAIDFNAEMHKLLDAPVEPVTGGTDTPPPAPVEPVTGGTDTPPPAPVAKLVASNGKTGKSQRFFVVDDKGNKLDDVEYDTEKAAWDAIFK